MNALACCSGVCPASAGAFTASQAAAADTWAAATDVPSFAPYPAPAATVSPVFTVESTPEAPVPEPPGAEMSIPEPKFEYDARSPSRAVAPTAMTSAQFAGA